MFRELLFFREGYRNHGFITTLCFSIRGPPTGGPPCGSAQSRRGWPGAPALAGASALASAFGSAALRLGFRLSGLDLA